MKQNRVQRSIIAILCYCLLITTTITETYGLQDENKHNQKLTLPTNVGTILFVGGTGLGNYSTIQSAIDNATDGDTIFVFNDSSPYRENINIDKTINCIGENKESTEISGDREGDVVNISADHVTITNFTIKYSGDSYYDSGIKLHSNYNIIKDNILSKNENGIFIISSQSNFITKNTISEYDKGIYLLDDSNENIIDGNFIRGGWAGVYVLNSCDNNIYSNNTVMYCYLGIGILDASDSIIISNIIQNNRYGLGMQNANNSVIAESFIADNKENGISIYESKENRISNNTFENDGLFLKESLDNKVSDNTVNGHPLIYLEDETQRTVPSGAGQIILVNCTNIMIKNQSITNTSCAINLYTSQECIIKENALSNNTKNIYLEESHNNEIDNNIVDAKDYYSISLFYSNQNTISDNKVNGILGTSAIFLKYSNKNSISRNILTNSSIISILRSKRNTVDDNIMSTGSGHISLHIANNNKIIGNSVTPTANGLGITIDGSDYNMISKNIITGRIYGIIVENSNGNIISRNNIQNNNQGINFEDSKLNFILRNNFNDNTENDASSTNSYLNKYIKNYWGKPYILPKKIPGKIVIYRDWHMPPIIIPKPSFDLRPAKTPNII